VAEIRALLFDMDGVLVDSNPLHCRVWGEYNAQFGVETTEAMHEMMYGKRTDQIIRDFLGQHLTDDEVLRHSRAKEALYRERLKPVFRETLVPGVLEFIDRHRGLPLAVASNAEPANIDAVIDLAGLRGRVGATVNGFEVAHPKPAPDIFLRAAELLGVPPENCVVFEDSWAGVEAGVRAGMRVVGLSTTHHDLSGVSLLIPDFLDPALERWFASQK
jgi:beta-phosphoglucomutase family hydrolase